MLNRTPSVPRTSSNSIQVSRVVAEQLEGAQERTAGERREQEGRLEAARRELAELFDQREELKRTLEADAAEAKVSTQ